MLGLGAHSIVRTVSGAGIFPDQTSLSLGSISDHYSSLRFILRVRSPPRRFRLNLRLENSAAIRCDSSRGRSGNGGSDRDDYLEASLLLSETVLHYRMRKRGFQEDPRGGKLFQFQPTSDVNFIGQAFLQRFKSPTIFLKISCDGDFLLPIVVGEFAVEKLMEAQWGSVNEDSPDQYQFLRNLVEKLGYRVQFNLYLHVTMFEDPHSTSRTMCFLHRILIMVLEKLRKHPKNQVNMVQITERVFNTYFARIFFSKSGEKEILSVDARPSDAINLAHRCKAPIYVNKQIVLMDAIRITYGMGRVRDTKPTYDVVLDSATEGPDYLSQELSLVKNVDLAVKEERYKDAAMWKDKLDQLRKSTHGH